MPTYAFRCPGCGEFREVIRSIDDRNNLTCTCGSSMRRVFTPCSIVVRGGLSKSRVLDSMRREGEMKAELKRDYGIEKFSPVGHNTTADVYRDVKGSGNLVQEQMAAEKERSTAIRNAKVKDWKCKAQKRASKRREEMRQRKEVEASQKRRITMLTGD